MADPEVKINAIRRKACAALGILYDRCPTCTREADNPFRRYVRDGHGLAIAEGCVDAFHAGLPRNTNTGAWHYRKEAVAIRAATLAALP